ncbi:MAG: hypothetical protein A2W91_12160 [Bacteroidetes bacterium GWF2_38_335]|nr:MAG: hypothetical protein A2W91_12160 [Bacteroidetes bacterium GWF2_38_335]OFY76926.1 MAG: hypothetical protein A2281_00275 [Bacteroidetes bacterium RIFOXYA12_FULL_38_20]HBS86776.1 hypothetical protein [Bacteroidales bacterium]
MSGIILFSCGEKEEKKAEKVKKEEKKIVENNSETEYILLNSILDSLLKLETPPAPSPAELKKMKNGDKTVMPVFINSLLFSINEESFYYENIKYFNTDDESKKLIDILVSGESNDRYLALDKIKLSEKYQLMPFGTKEELKKNEGEFPLFAYVKISRIAFNKEKNKSCFFFVLTYKGKGNGYLVFTEKTGENWGIKNAVGVWKSE